MINGKVSLGIIYIRYSSVIFFFFKFIILEIFFLNFGIDF